MTGLIAKAGLDAALGPAGAFFGKIPPKVWLALGCAVAAFIGVLWHRHEVKVTIADAEKAGEAKAYANVAAQASSLKSKADALNAQISNLIRSKADAENTRIVTQYRDVLVRGPGAAACTAVAGLPASAGGPKQAAAKAGAAVDPVPAAGGTELIALPFAGAVNGAREHDQLLNEDQAWRGWYARFSAQWVAWQAKAAKARAPAR